MSEDRVMVVTGASSGLGAEVSEHFALQGYRVAMNYLIEPEAQATFDRIAAKLDDADRLMKVQADVANREQVRAMFDAVVERFGRVDVLVNFAGINRDAPFVEMTDDMWDSVVSAHLRGHFVCCQEYVFHNPERPGGDHQPGRRLRPDRAQERSQLLQRQGRRDRADQVPGAGTGAPNPGPTAWCPDRSEPGK